uniref:PBS lyase n=1 Tax=Streptomyces sp. NBC_00049 TaxID=2903617 RepID=A0AAU2JGW3_9ACTN
MPPIPPVSPAPPTPSTADQLLVSLAPLPHADRLRLLAVTARDLARTGELAALLAELSGRGRYERRLAALGALAGRHTPYLTERLTDPDPVVRRYALRAVRTLPVPDGAIEAVFATASAAMRKQLAGSVLTGSRQGLAERLVRGLREQWGDHEAAALLPACGPEFVVRLLPGLAPAVPDWARLARSHPGPVLDRAADELAALPADLRAEWWELRTPAVAEAASAEPLRVLALLEEFGPGRLTGRLADRLGGLVTADAERVVRWLTAPERENGRQEPLPSPSVLRALVRADPPSLAALGRRWADRPDHLHALLGAMPPGRRAAFYDAAVAARGEAREEPLESLLLEVLPRERRIAEARRTLALVESNDRWAGHRRTALAYLPVAEVRAELLAGLGDPEPGARATGWQYLVENAVHAADSGALAEVVALMARRLRNDRDPVRAAALGSLGRVPAPLLRAAALGSDAVEHLDRIALDALEARDGSATTRWHLRHLVFKVLNEPEPGPGLLDWALTTLGRLADEAAEGGVLAPHGHTLRAGREDEVVRALSARLDIGAAKGDHRLLLALVDLLGNRAHGLPEVQGLLADALRLCDDASFPALVRVWLADRATRGERVEALLAREPSAAGLEPVRRVLSAQRTDLLDVVLAADPPYGRFLRAGADRPLPGFARADRWLPRQQEAAARLAEAAVTDASRAVQDRAAVIAGAARIPDLGMRLVRRHMPSQQVVLAEAALAASVLTDEPAAALGELLGHAGGDRARVALYAAGRAAAGTAPDRLAELLTGLLDADTGVKLTSRKEALRLAVRFLPPRPAAELLARVGLAPDSHPDLVTSAVSLAPRLLAFGKVWELLDSAVATGTEASRHAVLRTAPLDVAPDHRPRYGRLVAELAASATPEGSAQAFTTLPRWVAYAPEAVDTLRLAVCDLSRTGNPWRGAAHALGRVASSGAAHPVGGAAPGSAFHRTVEDLLAAVRAGDGPEAEQDRDLPALGRLRWLATRVARADSVLTAGFARQLAGEPSLTTTRVDLLVRTVDLFAPAPAQQAALKELAAAHTGRPALATTTAAALHEHCRHAEPLPDSAVSLELVRGLADGGALAEGLFAVALTSAFGPRHDWPAGWREQLRALRRHPEIEVRDAALLTVTRRE